LFVDVDLNDVGAATACVFSIHVSDSRLQFVEWQPGSGAIGKAFFAPVVRSGQDELFFGVMVAEDAPASGGRVGRLVFDVGESDPIVLSEDDFELTVGDVLIDGAGGEGLAATMAGMVRKNLNDHVVRIFHDRLEQNYPNPFNPQTTIAFSLKSSIDVNLNIYDVAGRRVRELINEQKVAGAYKVNWDGRNDAGSPVASGVYFYRIVAGAFVDTKKLTLLK
jgi:hypothetical protein